MRTVVAAVYSTLTAVFTLLPASTSAPDHPLSPLAPMEVWADGFADLRGIAIDADDNVFVADRDAGTVTRISPALITTIVASGLQRPVGLVVDPQGRPLVAEEGAGRVVRRETNGTRTPLASGIKQPRWLARGDDGTLYVSARRSTRDTDPEPDDESAEPETILALSPAGGLSVLADRFRHLQGVAAGDDAVFAATQGLRRYPHADGEILRVPIDAGGAAGTPLRFGPADVLTKPIALARDRLAALYVTTKEMDLRKLRSRRALAKLHPDGRLTLFAAALDDPQGLAFDSHGHLYVADGSSGHVIRFRAPAPPVLAVPTAVSRTALTLEGTAEPGARVDVFVNDMAAPVDAIVAASGRFTIDVTLSANVANRILALATAHAGDGLTSAARSAVIAHDDRSPSVTLTRPPGTFVRRTVVVEAAAADDGGAVAELVLTADGQRLQATVTPAPPVPSARATAAWDTTVTADGAHTLAARAADAAGNADVATRVVIVDNTPPETVITAGPTGDVADSSATFSFTGADNLTPAAQLTYAWRVDDDAWSSFSSAAATTVTGLAEGAHIFAVKARDQADNEDPTPAVWPMTVVVRPTITAVVPATAPIGTLITIVGAGFGPGPVAVRFNGVAAIVRTATTTSITTTVPPGAASGPLGVETTRGTAERFFAVEGTGDFALAAVPALAVVMHGGSTTYALEIAGSDGRSFAGLATLSVDPLPAGLTAAFESPTLTGGRRGSLRIVADATAALGISPITVRATAPTETGTITRSVAVAIDVRSGARTALSGRFTLVDGTPIGDIRLELAGQRGVTDGAGNFLVVDPPAGTQMLMVDANAARPGLPIYALEVTLIAGRVTELAPLRLTPPPPPERYIPIDNALADQVITDARFPGFALTLPAGVGITGWDGTPKSRIAVERLLPGDLAVPAPSFPARAFYQVFFGTPMGGLPSAPLPISLPNDQDLDPGQHVELWYYDAAPLPGVTAGWRLAGGATVSADGRTVVADPGVGLARFCGVCGVACINSKIDAQPNLNPLGPRAGEPVDLATGLMIVEKTDLFSAGRLPLALRRTYNPFDPFGLVAGFELTTGPGWTLSYDVALLEAGPSVRRLILPGNARFQFARQPDGTFVNNSYPDFAGAVLTPEPAGAHRLRLRNGVTWRFAAGWIPRGKSQAIAGLGLLVEERDRNGNTLTIARDPSGGIASVMEPAGRRLEFTTTRLVNDEPASARLTAITDPIGRTVRYGYDAARRLQTVTDPEGGVTRYRYDAAAGITAISDPRGISFLVNEYDAQHRVVRQTQADGGVWAFAYEGVVGAHSAVTVTDPRGHATVHRMTSSGFGSETVDPLGNVTRRERDAAGRPLTIIDAIGRVTRVMYDGAGNVARITDPAGATTTFGSHPTLSVTTSITSALGDVTRFEYDASGNVTAVVDALGARTTIERNQHGQAVAATDPLGARHSFEYDALGNASALIDPLGNRLTRAYDGASRLVAQTDPFGRTTTFAYDRLDRLVQIVDPAAGVVSVAHDANGNITAVTDAGGSTTTYTHDAMDRLAARTDPLGGEERFEYDPSGNLLRLYDRAGRVTTYTYDVADRRTAATYADGTSTTFVYDAADRVIQATESTGAALINRFDDAGHLAAQVTPLGSISYDYDLLARRRRAEVAGQPPVTYGYDPASRLIEIAQGVRIVGVAYDAAGRPAEVALPNGVITRYVYDPASRLVEIAYRSRVGSLGNLVYAHDPLGRLARTSGTLARTSLPPAVAMAVHDADNRQLAFGDATLSYDAAGNLTSLVDGSGTRAYSWDARNRLVALGAPGVTASFVYDPVGRRARATINGETTDYLYDGPDIALGATRSGEIGYVRLLGVDSPVARNGAEFYLTDRLSSVVGLTDTSGALVSRYVYDPFGGVMPDGTPTTNPLQFTGRENDGTGLHYFRARYYSPQLHRFLGQDLVDRLGANRYAYAGGDPVNGIDPFGLDTLIIYGALASSGPGGVSEAFGGNAGLRRINNRLLRQHEEVAVFNSGQQKEIVQRAMEAVRAGRPAFLVGHSLGGQRALAALAELQDLGITPTHVFTIDPFIADGVSVPPGVRVTNFYQLQSVINGRSIINADNVLLAGPGVGHFNVTAHAVVVNTIVDTIVGSRTSPALGGRY